MSSSSVAVDKVTAPKPYFSSATCRLGSTSKVKSVGKRFDGERRAYAS